MPMRLEGSCRCGAVGFSVDSHTPYPYQRCYCSICRKSAGGGGYAINIMGVAPSLELRSRPRTVLSWHAPIDGVRGSAERHFCRHCGTPLMGQRPAMAGTGASVCLGNRHETADPTGKRAPAIARQGRLGRAADRAR